MQTETHIGVCKTDMDKAREVLRYIFSRIGNQPNVGRTFLYKLLYFIDFDYYEKYEENLLGLEYIKNQRGPTTEALDELVGELIKSGEIEKVKATTRPAQVKYSIVGDIQPDLSSLSPREREHIDWEIGRLAKYSLKRLIDLSHQDIPWVGADKDAVLDYESVFYRTSKTSVREYDDTEADAD